MNKTEWLDKIINDELFKDEPLLVHMDADKMIAEMKETNWEKRMLHTFLGGKENG